MAWRTWKQQHDHDHGHGHGHTHLHDHSLDHGHAHAASNAQTLGQWLPEDGQDAHARAHAKEIRERFSNRHVTTGQIVLFGLTGGLIPCPASITVLLLCLQLKQIALGATLVLCFSVGLALTMVASGVVAALGVKHISQRWNGFGALAHKAPYFAAGVSMLIGLYLGYQGWQGLQALPTLG
jgi:ABC-type nickel/cobalt efflux system permease component RcnA